MRTFSFLRTLPIVAVLAISAGAAHGASCGTVAAPTVCTLATADLEYTFSNFQFLGSSGPVLFTAADIGIDVTEDSGGALVTFSKVATDLGIVFFANPEQNNSFVFSYDVVISPLSAGTTQFTTPGTVEFGLSSVLNSGLASAQMILLNLPNGESCVAVRNSGGSTPGVCDTLPAGTTNSLTVGNIVTFSAPAASNVSAAGFSNLLNATFSETPVDTVPEPSSMSLVGLGGVMLWFRCRKRR